MADTGFGVADDQLHRSSAMYGLPDLVGENYSAIQLVEAALSGFNERIDVSATYPTSTPDVFQRGGLGLFSTAADYMKFAQMLVNGGRRPHGSGERLIGRKTLELMHSNHVPPELLPYELLGLPVPGMGFGLGSRVMLDVAETAGPGSVGEYGWAGAAKTYYWVDPAEELVGRVHVAVHDRLLLPERDFRSLDVSGDRRLIDRLGDPVDHLVEDPLGRRHVDPGQPGTVRAELRSARQRNTEPFEQHLGRVVAEAGLAEVEPAEIRRLRRVEADRGNVRGEATGELVAPGGDRASGGCQPARRTRSTR